MLNSRRPNRRGSYIWAMSSIEGGLSDGGVIPSLVGGGYLLGVENLGGQRDLVARLHGGSPEVFG